MKLKTKYKIYRFLSNITSGDVKEFCLEKKYKYKTLLYPQKQYQETVNTLSYDYLRQPGEDKRNDWTFDIETTGLTAFHILNKMKEMDLKRKVKEGKKVRVCFLVDHIAKLSAIPVYEQMLGSELFEPFIVMYDENDGEFDTNQDILNDFLASVDKMKSFGYKVFSGYDECHRFIGLDEFKPDIVFTSAPYLDYVNTPLSNVFNNINYLVCYINYALNTVNNYDYHYNNRRIASCWKYFVETREDYEELLRHSKYYGTNAILTGYPKLDSYIKPIEECKIPDKINNGRPIVIFAPHHTINNEFEQANLATFHFYYKDFLALVKKYPEINFVFKPHPNLKKVAVDTKKVITLEEYLNYEKEWESLPNGVKVLDGNYIDLFRKSDLLITDCGSFIGEWLLTGKPCMYLVNPTRNRKRYMDGFSLIGRKILEKYYLCHNMEEIEKNFKMLMIDKLDSLKDERINIKEGIFVNIGTASTKICEYLTEILKD